MTVCTACIFNWNYAPPGSPEAEFGGAIMAAADRMYTDEGLSIEYEASRFKVLFCGNSHLILVSGDMPFNTECLVRFHRKRGQERAHTTDELAELYGTSVAEVRRKRAAARILRPVGLDEETFLASQATLQPGFVADLRHDMQNFHVGSEAILAGVDNRMARLFHVDGFGSVTDHTDIGFVSCGLGGVHATSQYMLQPYTHHMVFAQATIATMMAKKRGEVAPGVGGKTDLFLLTGTGIDRMSDEFTAGVEAIYDAERKRAAEFVDKHAPKVDKLLSKMVEKLSPREGSS